jgi:hypothetical protein
VLTDAHGYGKSHFLAAAVSGADVIETCG